MTPRPTDWLSMIRRGSLEDKCGTWACQQTFMLCQIQDASVGEVIVNFDDLVDERAVEELAHIQAVRDFVVPVCRVLQLAEPR